MSRRYFYAPQPKVYKLDDVDYSPMYKTPHPALDALAVPLGIDLAAFLAVVIDELRAEAKQAAKEDAKAKAKAAVKDAIKTLPATAQQPDTAKPAKGARKAKTTPEEAQAAIAQAMQAAEGAAA